MANKLRRIHPQDSNTTSRDPLAPIASNPPKEHTPPHRHHSPDTGARMHFLPTVPHERQPPPPGSSAPTSNAPTDNATSTASTLTVWVGFRGCVPEMCCRVATEQSFSDCTLYLLFLNKRSSPIGSNALFLATVIKFLQYLQGPHPGLMETKCEPEEFALSFSDEAGGLGSAHVLLSTECLLDSWVDLQRKLDLLNQQPIARKETWQVVLPKVRNRSPSFARSQAR